MFCHRWLLAILILAALVGLAGRPARSQGSSPRYQLTDLGTLGGQFSVSAAINATNEICGFSSTSASDQHAFLWKAGHIYDLGTLGGSASFARAINDSGQVVGQAQTTAGPMHAFLWTPALPNGTTGAMVDLGSLPGGDAGVDATGINASGQVVGASMGTGFFAHAYLWSPAAPNGTTGQMEALGTLGGNFSGAAAINAAGTVCGLSTVAGGSALNHPFVWTPTQANGSSGAMADLGLIAGSDQGAANALNDAGDVTGYYGFPNPGSIDTFRAFSYHAGQATLLTTPNAPYATGLGINDGTGGPAVVGAFGSLDTTTQGYLFRNSTVSNLNDLLPAGSGATITAANGINNSGAIAANATVSVPSGAVHPRSSVADHAIALVQPPLQRLKLTGSVSNPTPDVDDVVTFTFKISNSLDVAFSAVNVSLIPPDGDVALRTVTATSGDFSLSHLYSTVTVPGGGDVTITVVAKVVAPVVRSYPHVFLMTVNYDTSAGLISDQISIDIHPSPDTPRDVGQQVTTSGGAFTGKGSTRKQTVTLTNTGAGHASTHPGDLTGPIYLVLTNLQGAGLLNSGGTTQTVAPTGSPFVKANTKLFKSGQKLQVKLVFKPANPSATITYSVKVLAGSGTP